MDWYEVFGDMKDNAFEGCIEESANKNEIPVGAD